jgi:peptide/nickel transport system permease protein
MLKYILNRILQGLVVMWAVMTAVFLGLRAIPGDPVRIALGIHAPEESVVALRQELGLDQPLYIQYIEWMLDVIMLDFGRSITSGQQISVLLARSIPITLSIGVVAILIGLFIAIPAGIISATKKHQLEDYIATIIAFLGLSMPAFFFGIVLATVFGGWLRLVPTYGYSPLSEGVWTWFKHIILPAIAVGTPYGAIVMRMMRSSLLEVMNAQYMRTAKAKGLHPRVALFKHAMQNAFMPVVTVAGIQIAIIFVGSVTVEIVFGIRGLGRLLVNSMLNHDYTVVQAVILVVAAVMIGMNLLVDILYTFINPKIKY